MSIIIKGMEMPKNCDDCFFIGRGYPDWCSLPQIPNGEDEINDTKKRPDWCTLIELPEKEERGMIDREKVSDLLYKIYSIESSHLVVTGVIAKQYYCKVLWRELFGDSEPYPIWMKSWG